MRGLRALFGLCLLASAPGQAQTLHMALRQDPDVLDPALSRTYVGRIVFAGLCDKLFDIDEKLNVVPQLATGYQWADERTLLIHLRPGVLFQDNEKLDAAAVKYTLDRDLTMRGSYRRAEISEIDHVEVADPLTVRVVLKHASAPFLSQLTDRAGMIVAPKAAEAAGQDFGLHPVCAGPFSFGERVAQDHITLNRFPGYWDAKDIHFDRVVYQVLTDSSVTVANLHAGTIDLAEQVVPTDVAGVRKDPALRVVTSPSLGYVGITVNVGNGAQAGTPIGQSALLRQAFDAALDRQALVQVVYNGMYAPDAQALSPSSPFYVKTLPVPPRDLAKAQALVRQSGAKTPVAVTLMVPNQPDQAQLAQVIQAMEAEAGFDVRISLVEFASSLAAAAAGNFQAYQIGWSGRTDPDGNLYGFLHTGAGLNDGRYSNPLVDRMLEAARTAMDPAARLADYTRLMRQERQDLPILYLYSPDNIVGMKAGLTGFRPVPDGMIRLQGLAAGR